MNTDETFDPSPFAAFAAPKRDEQEEFREQERRAAALRRRMIGCLLAALVGAVVGATAGAGYERDFPAALIALVGALLGGAAGTALGAVLGATCFGALRASAPRKSSIGMDFTHREPMSSLRGLIFSWALIGTAVGASQGADEALKQSGEPRASMTRVMTATLIGGAFGMVVWFSAIRAGKRQLSPGARR